MLFTRCPGCQTTFRITADTLRVANGAVRCGSCAMVFSAYSGLRQDALDEGMRHDEEFLSPTLQTQELARTEEIASPQLDETQTPANTDAEDTGEIVVLETEPADEEARSDPDQMPAPELNEEDEEDLAAARDAGLSLEPDADPASAVSAEQAAEPLAGPSAAPAEAPTVTPSPAREAAAAEGSGRLHFETPVDEWAELLSEIERSVSKDAAETDRPAAEASDSDGASPVSAPAERKAKGPAFWDVGEPFSLASWDPDEPEAPLSATEQDAGPDLAAPASQAAKIAAAQRTDAADDGLNPEIAISAEEIDATLSAEPEPDLAAAFEAGLGPLPPAEQRSRLWTYGAAAMVLLLTMQGVHHYRAALVSRPVIGGAIRTTYALLGFEVLPAWNLEQYEISNWAATAAPGELGAGNLQITARIRNGGPQAQPYPSIQLELKDRWEAVIGSRIFRPREYLAADFDASKLMAAGATVPAQLAVVDPGLDASGFELDVCLETEPGHISCAADRVFE